MLVNQNEFLIKDSEIPKVPVEFSEEARSWYVEQKKRVIEGYSVGGKYMPPQLYFYVNFWQIELSKGKSKSKILGRPLLRDIEWEIFLSYIVCRGLSGFNGIHISDDPVEVLEAIKNGSYSGTPDYNNQSLDLMIVTARETGKSFCASNLISHEWLFDGQKKYVNPQDSDYQGTKSNIVVGAGDSKFSTRLISKVKLGLDHLGKSGVQFGGNYYPHPFYKQHSGSFGVGKTVTAKYAKKIGGSWVDEGTFSTINHVTYRDNPFAAQGSRNNLIIKEEVGIFSNVEDSYSADAETMMSGTNKYGTCVYTGTGGDMESGTLGTYKMFYSPRTYDILPFNDKYENKGEIGLFLPATMRPNEFKDDNGNTKFDVAEEYFLKERERKRSNRNSTESYDSYLQYNPLVPSESFLRTSNNMFPLAEIKEWLSELETNKIYRNAEYICDLVIQEDGSIKPQINTELRPIYDFPLDKNKDTTGAPIIFFHPDDDAPFGRYIAGIDPYDFNNAANSPSLGSMIVIDRLSGYVMCEYSGRPRFADQFYENCRKIAIYYNALVLYENEKQGVKQYFEKKNALGYLMAQPKYIKDVIPTSTVERGYGMHMNQALKDHGEILLRDWLQTEENEMLNLRRIRSMTVLKELIMYDDISNFDRIIAMIACMYAMQELHKQKIIFLGDKKIDKFFKRKIFQRSAIDYS